MQSQKIQSVILFTGITAVAAAASYAFYKLLSNQKKPPIPHHHHRLLRTYEETLCSYRIEYVHHGNPLPHGIDSITTTPPSAIGLDTEWTEDGIVRVIQVAFGHPWNYVAIWHRGGSDDVPHVFPPEWLKCVLEDTRVVKGGFGVGVDASKLHRQYGIHVAPIYECTKKCRSMVGGNSGGLASSAEVLLGIVDVKAIKISSLTCSDWSAEPLSSKQLEYAAFDAIVSLEVTQLLLHDVTTVATTTTITHKPRAAPKPSSSSSPKPSPSPVVISRRAKAAACTLLRAWRNQNVILEDPAAPPRIMRYVIDFGKMLQIKEKSNHARGVMRCPETGKWMVKRHGWCVYDEEHQCVIQAAFEQGLPSVNVEIHVKTDRKISRVMDEYKVSSTVLPLGREEELLGEVALYLKLGDPREVTMNDVVRVAAGCT